MSPIWADGLLFGSLERSTCSNFWATRELAAVLPSDSHDTRARRIPCPQTTNATLRDGPGAVRMTGSLTNPRDIAFNPTSIAAAPCARAVPTERRASTPRIVWVVPALARSVRPPRLSPILLTDPFCFLNHWAAIYRYFE